jgi:cytochrome c
MKSSLRSALLLAIAAGAGWSAGPARADADMLKRYNCMACHAVDRKVFGPTLKEIAARYAGDARAAETLARRIRAGGSGVWGEAPMPAQPQVPEADALTLAKYILSVQ